MGESDPNNRKATDSQRVAADGGETGTQPDGNDDDNDQSISINNSTIFTVGLFFGVGMVPFLAYGRFGVSFEQAVLLYGFIYTALFGLIVNEIRSN